MLTGGSANLKDIDELFRLGTKLDVRIAQPDMNLTEESCAKVNDPTYATVVGLLMRGSTQSQVALPAVARPVVAEPVRKVEPQPMPQPTTTPASQPASQPAQPSEQKQEEKPVPPIEQRPYVPPVVPATDLKKEEDEVEEEETDIYEKPEKKRKKWSFGGWLEDITKRFEAPGDEEI